jgi:hypothetical protein
MLDSNVDTSTKIYSVVEDSAFGLPEIKKETIDMEASLAESRGQFIPLSLGIPDLGPRVHKKLPW